MPSIEDITSLQDQINQLKKDVQDIRNIFLNIKLNSDMFLKIMRLEQREIKRDQEITNLQVAILNPNPTEKKDIKLYSDWNIEEKAKALRERLGWRDCKKCNLYGECDHQGAYKMKNGKWCYEDSGGKKPSTIHTNEELKNVLEEAMSEKSVPYIPIKQIDSKLPEFYDYDKVQKLITNPLNYLKPKSQTDIGEITLLHEDKEKKILQIKKLPEPIGVSIGFSHEPLYKDAPNIKLPKLNVPEKYQPYENVSLDRNHPDSYIPKEERIDGNVAWKIGTRKKRPDLLDEVLRLRPKKFTPFESEYKGTPENVIKKIIDDVPYCYQDKCVAPYKTPESLKRIKEFFEPKECKKNIFCNQCKEFLDERGMYEGRTKCMRGFDWSKHNMTLEKERFDRVDKLPEDYKPIEEITVKRKDYKTPKKEPSNFELRIDLPDDLVEGKLAEAPDTIDFNGTLYCKVKDVVKDNKFLGWLGIKAKYEALLNEQS